MKNSYLWGTSLVLFFWCVEGAAADKKTADSSKSVKSVVSIPLTTANAKSETVDKSKVEAFLVAIKKATSFQTIRDAILKAGFNEKEWAELLKQIKGTEYQTKILDLQKKAPAVKTQSSDKKIEPKQLKKALDEKQAEQVKLLNQKVLQAKPKLSAAVNVSAVSAPAQSTNLKDPSVLEGKSPNLNSSVKIGSVSPAIGVIGQKVTVKGSGFGTSGEAFITIGAPGSSSRAAFRCPVDSWRVDKIVLTIPLDVESRVPMKPDRLAGSGSEQAWLTVNPTGVKLGAIQTMGVSLDRERFVPKIASMTDSRVLPGQFLIIEGENLKIGNVAPNVGFHFGGRYFDVPPIEAEPGFVKVKLPENIEGMAEILGTVKVANRLGLSASKPITFVPSLEIVGIETTGMSLSCWLTDFDLCMELGIFNKAVQLRAGQMLKNGWTVEAVWLTVRKTAGNGDAYHLYRPEPGGVMAGSSINLWVERVEGLDSSIYCVEYFYVKGPKGTFQDSGITLGPDSKLIEF